MTLFYSHHDRPYGLAGNGFNPLLRTLKRLRSGLRTVHRAIAAAKIRRIRNELLLHGGARRWAQDRANGGHAKTDVASFSQRPAVLGEKWDF